MDDVRTQLAELKELASTPEACAHIDKAIALLPNISNRETQDDFVEHVLAVVDDAALDPTEGFDEIKGQTGSELLDKLALPVFLPTVKR